MTLKLKRMVSKQKRRYVEDGFDLDLTYITDDLIAMGFPSENLEGLYRNHMRDVVRLFDTKHKDGYKVYNLCSERDYSRRKFHGRVAKYSFDDHNPPRFAIIKPFCEDVENWLNASNTNVAAVHCKAGKGRTGVMICCYLLHSMNYKTSTEILDFYAKQRTHDGKGVTIASQQRYVDYYSDVVHFHLTYRPINLQLHVIELDALNLETAVTLSVYQQGESKLTKLVEIVATKSRQRRLVFKTNQPLMLSGDIKIKVTTRKMMRMKEELFHFWFNTFFLHFGGAVRHRNPARASLSSRFVKNSLPDVDYYVDRNHCCHYPADRRGMMIATFKQEDLDGYKKAEAKKSFSPYFRVHLALSNRSYPLTESG